MLFPEFARRLKGIIGGKISIPAFTYVLFDSIIDEETLGDSTFGVLDEYKDETFKSYYLGTTGITGIAKKIAPYADAMVFENYIEDFPDATREFLCEAFRDELPDADPESIHKQLARLFMSIITDAATAKRNSNKNRKVESPEQGPDNPLTGAENSSGPCPDIPEFPDYIRNSQSKYEKMKTLLYTSEEWPFYDFFVCNSISVGPRGVSEIIENVTTEKLLEKSRYALLVGMGGIGKSMMMRHLFLESLSRYTTTGILPVLVTLREFNSDDANLMSMIVDSVHRFDLSFSEVHANYLLSEGKLILLLDGLDEIRVEYLNKFQSQLDALIDRCPNNQFIMSTRRFSSFVGLSRFQTLSMMPFSHEQSLELVDRLIYYPEEPELKAQFRKKLEEEYFDTHEEFTTNPLLLTLMLMNYRRFADVPARKYLFYEQAYETLLRRHDSDKLAYKRVFRSVTDPADFTNVFREFCAKSYRKWNLNFSRSNFDEYFSKLKSVERLDKNLMKADNFLYDICHSTCLMYEEGVNYYFLHRSFQEYFFADYYSRQDDTTLRKLGRSLGQHSLCFFNGEEALAMLYDLAQEKVERFIIMPFLETIYEKQDENTRYWTFLENCYEPWKFEILNNDNIEKYKINLMKRERLFFDDGSLNCESMILSLILHKCNLSVDFPIDSVTEECAYPNLYPDNLYGVIGPVSSYKINGELLIRFMTPDNLDYMSEDFRCVLDENSKPVIVGRIYYFRYEYGITRREEFPAIVNLFESENFPARKRYRAVEKYYNNLKTKYAHADEMDDDDF